MAIWAKAGAATTPPQMAPRGSSTVTRITRRGCFAGTKPTNDATYADVEYPPEPSGLAAVPGRSNHGLGLAVDLCGGVERFRSPEFNWMEQNGKKYGWIHPDWAYSSPFEPWHWEYDPKVDALP